MGYAFYEINRFEQQIPMKRGYAVVCKCHQRNCHKTIDRGISYLCYNCGWYFCSDHFTMAFCDTHDEAIKAECFAGESAQVCIRCARDLEAWYMKHPEYECHYDLPDNTVGRTKQPDTEDIVPK